MCPRAVNIPQATNQQTQLGKLWILLVGINQYNDVELPSLKYSALDCQGLGEALSEATDNTRELILHHDFADRKPELDLVRTSLKEIVASAQTGDTILFYFSGHGILDAPTQQVYLCLRDTKKQQLTTTGLPLKEILRLLGNCRASQQLIWLDACHSGGMTLRGTTRISLPNPTSQLVKVLRRKAEQSQGFYALLSCDHNQQSWEFPELGHGVFTYYLMRGLRGEAADAQGVIEADALYQYVYHRTLRYIDRSNQKIRLINQQKSGRGERQLQSEYPLQTPKRIVEGFGKVIIGQWGVTESDKISRQALVIDAFVSNQTTLELSKLLRGRGGFNVEYLPSKGKKWTDIKETIASCLKSSPNADHGETTTAFLYLRGRIQYDKTGVTCLVFKDGAYITREWLRKVVHQSKVKQQIIILDFPNSKGIKEWLEELRLEDDCGQCIIGYDRIKNTRIKDNIHPRERLQQFTQTLISTLQKSDRETGLSLAAWISQLQIELAGSDLILQIGLSSTRGVIEVLPEKSKTRKHRDDSTILDINVCPYMGLQAFTEENAQYFYGRDALVQRLVNHVNHENTLAVIGALGSGKSSVVQAGLFEQLSQGKQIPQSDRWMLKCFCPGSNPFLSLAQCLSNEAGQKVTGPSIEQSLSEGVEGFVQWLRLRPEPMVVLLVDQFEELFTLASEEERKHFVHLLLKTIEYAGDRFKLIFTLRADFIASCLEIPELSQIIQKSSILVPPYLTESEYREAIVKPATQVGLKVEPGLEEILLQELSGGAGDLPLLQYVLQKLWENRKGGVLTLSAYRQLGGIKGALEQQAQELYDSLDAETQEAARWIFLNLTKIGDGTENTRRRVTKSDLIVAKYPADVIEKTLEKLNSAKLIVTKLPSGIVTEISSGDRQNPDYTKLLRKAIKQEPTIEVVHEILIRNWSTLRWWLEEDRSRLQLQRQIEQAAFLWKNKNQQPDFLLRGIRLAEAEEIFIQYTDELAEVSQDFITACLEQRSQEQREIKRRLRQKRMTIILGILSVIALLNFARLVYRQKLISQLENINDMNAVSEALLLSNQQLSSILTSVKAGQKFKQWGNWQRKLLGKDRLDGIETRTAAILQQAIYGTQELNYAIAYRGISSIAPSPTSSARFATADSEGKIKIWQLNKNNNGQELIPSLSRHESTINQIEYSRDGKILASAGADNTIKIWDIESSELISTLKVPQLQARPQLGVNSITFSQDRNLLISGNEDKTIQIWDLTNNRILSILEGHSDRVKTVIISPNNKIIASGGDDNTIKIWTIKGELLQSIDNHNLAINSLKFTADGKILASASSNNSNNTIKLWQVKASGKIDPEPLQILSGHKKEITSLAFSKDGKLLISGSGDRTIKLWQTKDGTLLKTLQGHSSKITSIALIDNDQTIISADEQQGLLFWSLDLDYLLAQGCDRVSSYLKDDPTVAERDRNICN